VVWVIAGAIINVAVAWFYSIRELPANGAPSAKLDSLELHDLHVSFSQRGMSPRFDDKGLRFVLSGERVIQRHLTCLQMSINYICLEGGRAQKYGEARRVEGQYIRCGWPMYSVSGERWRDVPDAAASARNLTPPNSSAWEYSFARELPLKIFDINLKNDAWFAYRPLWLGFVVNTICFAAILWMIINTPKIVRRRLRIRAGLCAACAYPTGSSDVCTECGAAIRQ
jgi:hypothetical protein